MRIDVRHNMREVAAKIGRLSDDVRDKAAVRAVNRAAQQARTEMSSQITREYNVRSTAVKERLGIVRARYVRGRVQIEAVLFADGKKRSMNVARFLETSVSLAEAKRRAKSGTLSDLRFRIKKRGGKKMIRPEWAAGKVFIGNNGRTVFARTSKARLPINPVQTIDVPQMFNAKNINRAVVALIEREFPRIFEHEARYYLGQFNAK